MHVKEQYSWLKHLDFILIDVLVLVGAFALSYYLKFGDANWIHKAEWRFLMMFVVLLDLVITFTMNPYSGIFRRTMRTDVKKELQLTVYSLLAACFAFYVLKIGILFSREMLLEMYGIYFAAAVTLKEIWKQLVMKGKPRSRLIPLYVVCGEEDRDEVLRNVLAEEHSMYRVVGCAGGDGFAQDAISKNAREVLLAVKPGTIAKETYETLMSNGIGIHMDIDSMLGFPTENQFVAKVGAERTLAIGTYSFTPNQLVYLSTKRVFDMFCGLLGLLVLIPVTVIVKAAYLLTGDTAPIFYTQKRLGLYGKEIYIYKFRSMVPNADEVLKQLLRDEVYRRQWEENQKLDNDPRITKIGNFLRKTSLDELPQLINVLKGDMSLVGPRPLVPGELEEHGGLKLYQQVKPGITGWWGCNGRSNINYKERLDLEYYYVKHCSLALDILCIFKTIFVVLKRDGSK